jgi:hypothetical protein
MNLAEAFSQITCSAGEAQAILSTLITNMRDSYPDLYVSISTQIASISEAADEPTAKPARVSRSE